MASLRLRLYRGAPDFREPDDPPLVWKERSPEGYFTPSYGLGWRIEWDELYDYVDPSGEVDDLAYVRTNVIPSRWKEFGYANKYGWDVEPEMFICPIDREWEPAVIMHVFSNASQEEIEASQQAEAAGIIEAARHVLGLDVEDAPELKWYSFVARSHWPE